MASNRATIVGHAGDSIQRLTEMPRCIYIFYFFNYTLIILYSYFVYILPSLVPQEYLEFVCIVYANIAVHAERLLLQPFRLYQRAGLNRYFKTEFRSQVIVGYILSTKFLSMLIVVMR